MSDSFLSSLSPFGAYDRILSDGAFKVVPLRSRVVMTTLAATAHVIGERDTKIQSKLQLESGQLDVIKTAAFVVCSEEVLKFTSSGGLNLLSTELRKAIARATDQAFLDQLLNSTAIQSFSSSGMSAAQFSSDLSGLLDNLEYGADAKLYAIVPPATMKLVALMRDANGRLYPGLSVTSGGNVAGIEFIVSDAASDMVLLDASQVCAGSDGIVLDASDRASILMDDAVTSAPVQMTSLWQQNLRALKAERSFGVAVVRESAVVALSGVTS
jgi:HK97 family phage major capsid protein